jgi:hypothetical protein
LGNFAGARTALPTRTIGRGDAPIGKSAQTCRRCAGESPAVIFRSLMGGLAPQPDSKPLAASTTVDDTRILELIFTMSYDPANS